MPTAAQVVHAVATVSGVTRDQLLSPTRKQHIARARQLAMALVYRTSNRTAYNVGTYFKRDRTTVLHACRLIEGLLQRNDDAMTEMYWEACRVLQVDGEALRPLDRLVSDPA